MSKAPKFIIAVIVLVAVGWGGYWFIGSTATEKVLGHWFEERRDEGWTASYASLNTAGFPSRFDTTITDLTLADPETGIAWSAPIFQNLSLSYRPTQVIAVLPGEQVFATRNHSHRIESETFRASATFRPAVELPIERSVIEIDQAQITSEDGKVIGLGHAQMAMRETPGRTGHVYDFDIRATGIRPDTSLLDRVTASGALPAAIQEMEARATIRFDNAWDRFALERARPQPREIELTSVAVKWGALELDVTGILVVDDLGIPDGELHVKAQNWRDIIAILEASGTLDRRLTGAVTRAAELLAKMSGDPETVDATLKFERGRAFLGPIPVGEAPKISLP